MNDHTWETAFERFDDYLRGRGRRHTTRKSHASRLRSLARHVDPAGPGEVTGDQVTLWLATLDGVSRRNAWVSARVFYGWARWAGVVDVSPVPEGMRRKPSSQRQRDAYPAAWADAVLAWTRELESTGRAPLGIEVTVLYVRQLAASHPEGPHVVTRDDVATWLAGRPDWKPETRRNARGSVARFFAWMVATGRLDASPVEGLASVRVPRAVPRPATSEAVSGALVAASDRDGLMVLLGSLAGLRAAEIAAVRPSTDVQDGWLYVTGKGGHTRRVPLHPVLESAIDAEMVRRRTTGRPGSGWRNVSQTDADDYLFPSPGGGHVTPGCVTDVLRKLLPGRATAHTLRHRFASEAYASCLDIRAVQELLGHASVATTQRYTAVPAGQLVAAVRGIR